MDPEVAIALIGVAGTAIAGLGGNLLSGWLEARRADRNRTAERLDETRGVIEAASDAWVEARITLDSALTGQQPAFNSADLFGPMLKRRQGLAMRLGSSHPITAAYSEVVDAWMEAVNLGVAGIQQNKQPIADARNKAADRMEEFLELAAGYVGPESHLHTAPSGRNTRAQPKRLTSA